MDCVKDLVRDEGWEQCQIGTLAGLRTCKVFLQ